MNRRGFLRGLLGAGAAALLPFEALAERADKKRKWNAVLMVGFDENNVPTIEFVNHSKKAIAIHLRGLQISGESLQRDILGVHDGETVKVHVVTGSVPKESWTMGGDWTDSLWSGSKK